MIKPFTFEAILLKFRKTHFETHKLSEKYEALRPEYEKAAKAAQSGRLKAAERLASVTLKMQGLQARMEKLWKSHRRALGPCSRCGGVRMPVTMGKKRGLGCFNHECYHFEVLKKRAS